ncbi:MFS transporter [Microbacterium sp. STN6]|uniref:MFS transporter n=1 Tax=Microbacterium sp. STN6 TaxID=2995588 RepID=UPI002260AB1E|nr:MFS transporter [Microbacterium sp. STN6]MCX7522274.1 MFS transporter [Microbacterium sp. STN6]
MTNDTLGAPQVLNEATINPKTGRPAGKLQGILLLIGSCLPVLGAVLLAPILPILSKQFASAPGADALVPLILTIPALMIAILAPFAGAIVDRVGRKRVLIWALLAYAVLGTMPLWLETLGMIVLSRVGVGITEAFIMTCCTTLIADYFSGNRRNRYLGLQAMVTALAATVFFAVGGAMGSAGWRTPFWLYAASLIVAVAMVFAIWPVQQSDDGGEKAAEKLEPIRWSSLFLPSGVTIFGGLVFYTLIVELPYVLDGLGVTSTATIGVATALASLATAIGAFLFRWLARHGVRVLLPLAFVLAGIGMLVVAFTGSVAGAIVGAVIAGFGTGILLPTMLTWAITRLSYEQRGRGTGLWTAALFFGEFITPLIVLALTSATGTLPLAIAVIGVLSLVATVVMWIVLTRNPQPALAAPAA